MATLDIYARISSDREGAGLGVARQEKDCRNHLAHLGHAVGEVHVDNDISGYKRKTRPGYQQLLQRLAAGDSDGFVVWHLDRLTRHPAELEDVIEIVEKRSALVLTVTGGAYDLATTDGRAMARVVGAFARKESEDKARRTTRKHLELAEAGRPVGGSRHLGFEPLHRDGNPVLLDASGHPTLQVRGTEAALIREAVDGVLAGDSVRSIVRRWNDAGLVAPRGGRFTASAVRRVLRSPTIAGWRGLAGEPVAPGTWEPIIDVQLWRQVRAVLDHRAAVNSGGFTGSRPRTYLLTGLLRCGRCGTRMVAQARGDRKRSYTCPSDPSKAGCGRVRIVAPDTEDEIATQLFDVLDLAMLSRSDPPAEDPTRALLDELGELNATRDQLATDHYVDHLIDRSQFFAASAALEERIALVEARLANAAVLSAHDSLPTSVEELVARWDTEPLHWRRALIERYVERVTVLPASAPRGRFDPSRLDVTWVS